MRIKILLSAMENLKIGEMFYEQQQVGVGDYFIDSLFSDIDSLLLYAGIHQQFFGYYRLLSSRFPYAIYYKVDEAVIEIWRVLDCRQKPTRALQSS